MSHAPGHGLGSIAGEVARTHGGTPSVSSRPGQGSIFTVTLRAEKEARP